MAKRRHRSRERRNSQAWKLYIFLTGIIAAGAIFLGCVIFFKIDEVQILVRDTAGSGASDSDQDHYTTEEYMQAAGIRIGDNLCLLNKNRAAAGILQKLPYVSDVSIRRRLPGTLVLTISQSEAAAAIQDDSGTWWLIDDNCRLLEQSESSQGCAILSGLTMIQPEVGQGMRVPDGTEEDVPSQQAQKEGLMQLFQAVREQNLQDMIVAIDASSDRELMMDYGGKIQVLLPIHGDFRYNMRYFAKMLTDYFPQNWSEKDTGILDMTYSDGHPHLIQNS